MQLQSTIIDVAKGPPKRKRSPSKERPLDSVEDERTVLVVDLSPSLKRKKPRFLRIDIPSALNSGLENIQEPEDTHSLFSDYDTASVFDDLDEDIMPISLEEPATTGIDNILASRSCPPIPGLFFEPSILLPQEFANKVVSFCMKTYFLSPADNQVMLFGRFLPEADPPSKSSSEFPQILLELLEKISHCLRPNIPPDTYSLLFPARPTTARQAIINLYNPGEGITPHVDLLGRYDDGIIGVSFSSGTAMRFDKVNAGETDSRTRWDVYLPERTIIVLSEEARYKWTHGIDKKWKDFVSSDDENSKGSWMDRGIRMSITFRWLLPGADVVGSAL